MTARDRMVHTVLFDAGMTLLRITPSFAAVFARGCHEAGLAVPAEALADGREALAEVWREHDEAWHAAGEPSPHVGDGDAEQRFWQGLYRRVLAWLGTDGDHDHVAATIHRTFLEPGTFRPYPDVEPVLDLLARRGIRLGLVSNWSGELRSILHHEGLADRFETLVISAEEGVAKPDVRLFRRALERLGVGPGPGVVYVGDDLRCDIQPSQRLGLTPVLIDRYHRHPDHDGHRVSALDGLLDVLPLRTADLT